jgi:hypothetical protein
MNDTGTTAVIGNRTVITSASDVHWSVPPDIVAIVVILVGIIFYVYLGRPKSN